MSDLGEYSLQSSRNFKKKAVLYADEHSSETKTKRESLCEMPGMIKAGKHKKESRLEADAAWMRSLAPTHRMTDT